MIRLKNFKVESMSSSINICIDVSSRMQALHSFLAGISASVTDLTLSANTLWGIYDIFFNLQQLPKLHNLTHLNACFSSGWSGTLPIHLSSFPNLKSLDLGIHGYPEMKVIASVPVPRCFQTSLEYVEIKMTPMPGQARSRTAETEFAKYILENATVLKKLTLWRR